MLEIGKKYNRRTLFRMKQFYNVFSNEKVSPLVTQLTWSQCLILLPLKDIKEIYYYALQVKTKRLTKRQLQDLEHEQYIDCAYISICTAFPKVKDIINNLYSSYCETITPQKTR